MEIRYEGQKLATTVEQLAVGLLAFEISDIIIKYFFLISKFKAKQYANSNDCADSKVCAKSVDNFLCGLKQNLAKLQQDPAKKIGSKIKKPFQSLSIFNNPRLVELKNFFNEFPGSFEGICNQFGFKLENLEDKKHEVLEKVFSNFSLNYLAISLLFRY